MPCHTTTWAPSTASISSARRSRAPSHGGQILGHRQTRNISCRLAPQSTAAPVTTGQLPQPDLVFEVAGTKAKVHVFGIDHRSTHPHVGEFILRTRPQAVVVETAVAAEHGAAPGTCISCSDQIASPPQAFFVKMFCQLAAQLQEQGGEEPWNSELWQQMRPHYRGEQLAYVAAFVTGAKLVFGDRPKDITYRRLAAMVTPAQLDEAYGALCEEHFRTTLGLPSPQISHASIDKVPALERIMMQERDAVICKVLDSMCREGLPKAGLTTGATSVVLVVGRAHLAGLQYLWEGQHWKQLVAADDLASSPLLAAPPLAAANDPQAEFEMAVRRGLLQAAMRMMVTHEVLSDMNSVLGPVTPAQQEVVEIIDEIYSCSRMMLAALPRDLLTKVCLGYQCDMYEVLEPFRRIRPALGGPAYAPDIIGPLRALNFELD